MATKWRATLIMSTDAAKELGVSPQTLRALEKRGKWRARRDWTGKRRYSPEDVEALRALLFPEVHEGGE